jgi:HPr kinase/phosphorylase
MTAASLTETVHATSVAIGGQGVLIMGISGSGKSDLALRLIDRGAMLVSDDYTIVRARDGVLLLAPPANIAGTMEIRHLGLVEMPHVEDVTAVLAIRLEDSPPRMPDPFPTIMLAGIALPLIALAGREPSAPIKVDYALRHLARLTSTS